MEIEIVGTESLGVRGLCCVVRTAGHVIVIDPGVALGYKRHNLLPHPVQVAAGERVRTAIGHHLAEATDVVLSHFHGDHMPLADANPYQLSTYTVADLLQTPALWIKRVDGEYPRVGGRRTQLLAILDRQAPPCDGQQHGRLTFSETMPHDSADSPMGTVMMTRIEEGSDVFVHASDIQLLSDEPVDLIREWAPTIVLASGPALYRDRSPATLARARDRALQLADIAEVCIIDHHPLRSADGVAWLDELRAETDGRILCAADYMQTDRSLLEARRAELYDRHPVPADWHERYAEGKVTPPAL